MPVYSGNMSFSNENQKTVTFSSPLPSADYAVQVSADTFVWLRVVSKTVNGFTVEASANFTGVAGYDVFQ